MDVIVGIDQLRRPLTNPVVTLGNFDGIHLGHQRIFERVKQEASRTDGEAVVITFEPHPLKVLAPGRCPPLLTPFRQKIKLIEKFGIDAVLCIKFTPEFSNLSPYEFVRNILYGTLKVRKIVVGYNYHFGSGKAGNAALLRSLGEQLSVEVEIVDPLKIGSRVVSSSAIRDLLMEGDVEEATKLLGRHYSISGEVIEGRKRGHRLGFPTANLKIEEVVIPKKGVYAVDVLWNSRLLHGVASIGSNPTFRSPIGKEQSDLSLEVHIFDFNQDIYRHEIEVRFRRRIRDEKRFESSSHLAAQIERDVIWAKENVFARDNSIINKST